MLPRYTRRVDGYLIAFLLAAVASACAWIYRDFAQDDAFITYRYARNLATGQGFVYNPGEFVLGTTTPLYTLVLALLQKLTGQEIRIISHFVSVASLWVGGLALYALARNLGFLLALGSALLYATNPLLVSAVGMETLFLLALAFLALCAYLADRHLLTGILLGLLLLTRYDTVLLVAVLGIHFFIRHRRLPVWMISTALIFLPWLVFAERTYGHVLPQSAAAKMVERVIGHGIPFAKGAVIWCTNYLAQSSWYLIYLPLLLLGVYHMFRTTLSDRALRLILAWSLLYLFMASLIACSFSWYYAPLIPVLSLFLVLGVKFLVQLLVRLLAPLPVVGHGAAVWPSLLFAILILGTVVLQISSWTRGWVLYKDKVVDGRYVCYHEAGEWLRQEAGQDATLAAFEIGVIGYYTDLQIVDLMGLVTPTVTPWLSEGYDRVKELALARYRPDYLLFPSDGYEQSQSFQDGLCAVYAKIH